MTKRRHYEAMSIVQCILEGYSKAEAGREFGITPQTIDKKLRSVGYTYVELVQVREERKKKQSS